MYAILTLIVLPEKFSPTWQVSLMLSPSNTVSGPLIRKERESKRNYLVNVACIPTTTTYYQTTLSTLNYLFMASVSIILYSVTTNQDRVHWNIQ